MFNACLNGKRPLAVTGKASRLVVVSIPCIVVYLMILNTILRLRPIRCLLWLENY